MLTPLSAAPAEMQATAELAGPAGMRGPAPARRAAPALPAPRWAGRMEVDTCPCGSVLTFACLPVGLQREANRAAASHSGGRVLARPVTASIIYCTRLWGGKETDMLSFLRQRPPPSLPTGHLLRQEA